MMDAVIDGVECSVIEKGHGVSWCEPPEPSLSELACWYEATQHEFKQIIPFISRS